METEFLFPVEVPTWGALPEQEPKVQRAGTLEAVPEQHWPRPIHPIALCSAELPMSVTRRIFV